MQLLHPSRYLYNKPLRMQLFSKLLGKKKTTLKPKCPITREPIEEGFGLLLTTAQVITSSKYWDLIMTEPETMSYTVSHFRNQPSGTQMRTMIFEKYSTIEKPWMVSDSCLSLFDGIDKQTARENARQWWANDGNFSPANTGKAVDVLPQDTFEALRNYAILEAGRQRASFTS